MADISKINVKGTEYNLKDAWAREQIAAGIKFHKCTAAGDTPKGVQWKSGGTTITGTLIAASTIKEIYLVPSITSEGNDKFDEYVVVKDGETSYIWEKFGDTEVDFSALGEFAWADTGTATVAAKSVSSSGSFTPAGDITGGGFTGSSTTFTGSYTPEGTISGCTFGGTEGDISVSGTSTGGISGGKFTGASTTFTGSYTPEGTVSATFEGTAGDVSVSGTTTGSVSSTFKGTPATISVSGTPKGHNASSSVTIVPTTATVVNSVTPSEDYVASVSGETLTFANKTYVYEVAKGTTSVWNGYTSATAAAQGFTGESTTFTGSYTPAGTVSSTFKGASMTSTGTFTPAGSITASFKGTPATISVSGTPLGSVSTIGFVGKPITLTGKFTPAGDITGCIFKGTSKSVSVSGTPKGSNGAITFKGKAGTVSVSGTVGSQTITVNPVK